MEWKVTKGGEGGREWGVGDLTHVASEESDLSSRSRSVAEVRAPYTVVRGVREPVVAFQIIERKKEHQGQGTIRRQQGSAGSRRRGRGGQTDRCTWTDQGRQELALRSDVHSVTGCDERVQVMTRGRAKGWGQGRREKSQPIASQHRAVRNRFRGRGTHRLKRGSLDKHSSRSSDHQSSSEHLE